MTVVEQLKGIGSFCCFYTKAYLGGWFPHFYLGGSYKITQAPLLFVCTTVAERLKGFGDSCSFYTKTYLGGKLSEVPTEVHMRKYLAIYIVAYLGGYYLGG